MEPATVIVTGSRGLIGRTLTPGLQKGGYRVVEADLALGQDLTDESLTRSWFAQNPAVALVNLFALNDHVEGQRESHRLMDVTLASLDRYLHVNVTALFMVCREFVRANEAGGSIVNFSSTYGLVSPVPRLYDDNEKHIGYSLSKAAVPQLTRHLAVHWAPDFRVNCVVPGGVSHQQSPAFKAAYGSLAPLGRMMQAEELVGIVEFLISARSSYCTGGTYAVDGGWTAW